MPSPHQIKQRRPITANRLIEAINPKGRSTTYTYDTLDRLLDRTDATGKSTTYQYDANVMLRMTRERAIELKDMADFIESRL